MHTKPTHILMNTHIHLQIHAHTHAHTYESTHTCTHTLTYTHKITHAHSHTCMHLCMYTHSHTHMCSLTCIHVCTHRDKYMLHLFTDELFTLPHLSGVNDGAFKDFHFADLSHNPHTCSESTFSTEPFPKSNSGWLLRKSMMIFKKKV